MTTKLISKPSLFTIFGTNYKTRWYNIANLVTLGDSITVGYDGHQKVQHTIPELLKQKAHLNRVDNVAVSGTQMTGPNGLPAQVNKVNFKNYQYALIAFGTNDFVHGNQSLDAMRYSLNASIKTIKHQNPKIKIFITTPIQSFANAKDLNTLNDMGVSQNTIDNMIIDVAKENHIQYNDWRQHPVVTTKNQKATLGDQTIHPTQATMNLMADRYYNKFFKTQTKTAQEQPHHTNPSSHQLVINDAMLMIGIVIGALITILIYKHWPNIRKKS